MASIPVPASTSSTSSASSASSTPIEFSKTSAVHKTEFDKAVNSLVEKRNSILSTTTFSDLSRAEREARDALFALQHFSMQLGYWVKEAVDYQRQLINTNATISSDFLHVPLTKDPHSISVEKAAAPRTPQTSRTPRTRKTKKGEATK